MTDRPVAPPAKSRRGLRRLVPNGVFALTATDPEARREAEEVVGAYERCVEALRRELPGLAELRRPRLLGKVEEEQRRLERTVPPLVESRRALERRDWVGCGAALREVATLLSEMGGTLTVALKRELDEAAYSRQLQQTLAANVAARHDALAAAEAVERASSRSGFVARAALHELTAEWFRLTAEILAQQARPSGQPPAVRPGVADIEGSMIPPQQLETLADVGGLEEQKEELRRTVGAMLENSATMAATGVVYNGVLLHGPPGTGKTLLGRALAGEYGLRFLRFSPALIGSAYQHEPARKLRQMFAQAAESVPCLLFLDEIDSIAGKREGMTHSQRELVTQLLNSLEEYRAVPGLVIMAATNAIDHLDPALRVGRFDARVAVPLPPLEGRARILAVQLERLGRQVQVEPVDLDELARRTSGRSGAALAGYVNGAAQRAFARGGALSQADLVAEIDSRSGQDRVDTLEDRIGWDDVILPAETRDRIHELLLVFRNPESARSLGIRPPAGILLYGPPGTGKTTIARALATEAGASFYEQSAADLMSKWVGETEQRVAQLFSRARENRPSVIFCDEIDALLKSRVAGSASPWEERVVSQFLRELDGLHSGDGVLLVGATNRVDMIDVAVRDRRLLPIEIGLPDLDGRRRLLEVLCREVRVSEDVDLDELAQATEGLSGADLKTVRNRAGMRALARADRAGNATVVALSRQDLMAVLEERTRPR